MKVRQGVELPDELVFRQVAENNELARVTIISKAEIDALLNRRVKVARKRLWFLERRKDLK